MGAGWKNTMKKLRDPGSVCSRIFRELVETVPESLVFIKDKGRTKA